MRQLPVKWSYLWSIILAIYFFYFAQGTLYSSGGIVSQTTIFILLLIGLVSCIRVAFMQSIRKIPTSLKLILALLALLAIIYLFSPDKVYSSLYRKHYSAMSQFKNQCVFLLSIFTGYIIGRKKTLPEKQFAVTLIVLLIFAIYVFSKSYAQLVLERETEEVTNNEAYTFVYILPFLALTFKRYKTLTLVSLCVIFVYVIIGMKRGAIICLSVAILYVLRWLINRRKLSFWMIIALSIMIICGGIYIQYVIDTVPLFGQRFSDMTEGNSSGRDQIFENLTYFWLHDCSLINMIVGNGSAYTVKVAGNFGHNDWLELLIDAGMLSVIIYVCIFLSLHKFIKRSKIASEQKLCMSLIVLIWFTRSIFSMGIDNIVGGLDMMLLGYLMANVVVMKNQRRYLAPKVVTNE